MKSKLERNAKEHPLKEANSRTREESLAAIGAKLVIKTGSIFMPLSKIQREQFRKMDERKSET